MTYKLTDKEQGKVEMINYVLNHYCDCELCKKIKKDLNKIKYDLEKKEAERV